MQVNGLIAVPCIFAFGFFCLYMGKGPSVNTPTATRNHRTLCLLSAIVIAVAGLIFAPEQAVYAIGGLAIGFVAVMLFRPIGRPRPGG